MKARPIGITIAAIVFILSGLANLWTFVEAMKWLDVLHLADTATKAPLAYLIGGIVAIVAAVALWTLKGWAWTLGVALIVLHILADLWVVIASGFGTTLGIAAIVRA
jgi:hypothetical protein